MRSLIVITPRQSPPPIHPVSCWPSTSATLTGSVDPRGRSTSWYFEFGTTTGYGSKTPTASLGSSAVWGTFDTRISLPASVRGNLTLELFESSPKDGTAQGIVQIPLAVR